MTWSEMGFRRTVRMSLAVACMIAAACHRTSDRIQLNVTPRGTTDGGDRISYSAEIRNSTNKPVWVPVCYRAMMITFQMRFEYGAGATNVLCDREERVALAAGATLRDTGSVRRGAGAEYEPVVSVYRSRTTGRKVIIRGGTFRAP